MVMAVRATLPKTGGRKLHSMLSSQIKSQGIKIGRDKLFDFLREEHLLIKTRRKYHKTTNSKHWMRKYPNLIKDIEICMPEQVWVADITYLMMKKKHYYLHLITDAYSKKIVGYQLADNLQAETTLNALRQAILNRIYDHKLIHHSDRGLQYCSSQYTALLSENGISISMTENSDPYENAVAERVNGILKDEFMLDINFESYFRMKKQVQQSINAYNHLRLHTSIGMLTPNKAHLQNKIILKTWKKKNPLHVNEKGSLSLV
jgi:transposase InsO family protein